MAIRAKCSPLARRRRLTVRAPDAVGAPRLSIEELQAGARHACRAIRGEGKCRPAPAIRSRAPSRASHGDAIADVVVDANGLRLLASVTVEAVEELGLREGTEVMAIIKASEGIPST
jgi:molybdopterin-binding protein